MSIRTLVNEIEPFVEQIDSHSPLRENVIDRPKLRLRFVRALIAGRRQRNSALENVDFGEPGWDIILDLYQASLSGRRTAVSSLCIAANVPATTALRYISSMTQRGLLMRDPDPMDGRRVFIRLSDQLEKAIEQYFDQMLEQVVGLVAQSQTDHSSSKPGNNANVRMA